MCKPNQPTARPIIRISKWSGIFTPVGAAVLVITLIILIRSLFLRNAYEIVLSSALLFLLFILGFVGVWKSKKLKTLEPGWKPPYPMTANSGIDGQHQTQISGFDVSVPLFFRLHYYVRGWFLPGGSKAGTKNGCRVSVETSVPRGEIASLLPLDFPIAGVFHGDGFCRLRDIFGFFSFSCGQPQHRTVNVRCAPCFGKKIHINAQTGAEDRKNKPAADIERYYMREYSPGDRFRDINWKSSEKIDALITRISTDNQEKVSRIEVFFRNYGNANSLEAIWLLDRAKARLSYFLRSLMEQNSTFIFDVRTASGSWEIEDQNDLDSFFEELTGLPLMPVQNETAIISGIGDMYVFSTACDIGLPAFLLVSHPRPVTLFLIQPEKSIKEVDILRISDFYSKGCTPSPLWFRKSVKRLNVQANKMEMFYAGIKL